MKKLLHSSIVLIVLSTISFQSRAQYEAGNYSFTATSGTYNYVVGGTDIPGLLADTKLEAAIPIGFDFEFENVTYNSVRPSSNGYISFNTTSSTTNSGTGNDLDFFTTDGRPLVAPLWDDHDGRAAGGSRASYITTGVAPNRVFTFEWAAWEWNYAASDSVISFQVKLYETTNEIEFIYKQEFDAVNSGSASIGIAGAATGTGNYLSLNGSGASPSASSTSETTNINSKPATGQIYRFAPPVIYAVDLKVIDVITPEFTGCRTNNETIKVVIQNGGTSTIDFSVTNATIGAIMTGANPTNLSTTLNTGILAFTENDTITVTTAYDMTAAGDHEITGYNVLPADANTANDTMANPVIVNVGGVVAPLQSLNFDGFTGSNLNSVFPHWSEASGLPTPTGTGSLWRQTTGLGYAGNSTAVINLYTTNRREWIKSEKFLAVANSAVVYKVAVTDWLSVTAPDPMGSDDRLYVGVSTDCGYSWTYIDSVTAADNLQPDLVQRTADLSAYTGQEIMIGFLAQDGPVDDTEDYDLHIDDIEIRQIDLLDPIDGTNYVVEGVATDTIDAVWTADHLLSGTPTYLYFLDTLGGDFSNPYAVIPSNNSGSDTMLTFDMTTIDGLLTTLGLNYGDSIDLIWTVRAYNATDSVQAKEHFNMRLFRGYLLEDFDLISPATGTALTIEGNENNIIEAKWEQSIDTATYVWVLETAAGLPLTMFPTNRDTSLELTYGDIDAFLAVAPIGTTVNLRWTAGAIISDDTLFADNGYFTLDLTRGAVTTEFALLTPANASSVIVEGNETETLVATWEEAQVNGDGDITYTWMLDKVSGDFTAPLLSMSSDNNGIDESMTITYRELDDLLANEGLAINDVLNAQWMVITNIGDTAVFPFNLDITRGIVTGIEENQTGLSQLNIYPNPSKGIFTLTVDDVTAGTLNIEVLDINGRKVIEDRVSITGNSVVKTYNSEDLTNGVYLFRVYNNTSSKMMKLIIQK